MEVITMKLLGEFYNSMKMPNSTLLSAISVAIPAALVLLLPFAAMLFTGEVNWSFFDFIFAWTLLFGAGFTYRMVARKMDNITYRAAVGVTVGTALFLVWANLAVGLIGSEDNPANWMYMGVLSVGFLGAIIARLQPKGMSRVLFAMAFAHVLIVVIALIARLHLSPESSVVEILGVNGFFAVLWSASALLFRNAGMEQAKP
jgi:hypothetical protein